MMIRLSISESLSAKRSSARESRSTHHSIATPTRMPPAATSTNEPAALGSENPPATTAATA